MMGGEATETCWATDKRQVINLCNCCILLVDLFKIFGSCCEEAGQEANSDTAEYIVMSRDQNATRSHSINIDYISFERFQIFGKNLTNSNSIQEEIKSRLKSGNACYHSVQSFVFHFAIQKFKN